MNDNIENQIKEKCLNAKECKILLSLISIGFAIPSIIWIFHNKTVLNLDLEFYFLFNHSNRILQTSLYVILLVLFIVLYWHIIKKRDEIFQNMKQIYGFIITISAIFILVLPFMSSDIFYYMGIGRLSFTYKQNPYYMDMKTFVNDSNIDILNDTVMQKGYNGYWSGTTVIYGAFWTFICSVMSFLSFGNVNIGLLIFKLLNALVHFANCYLLYKISKKKIFPLLYGINPFILIEGIANVHNDIFIILLILLALYELLERKRIIPALLFLALATDIKYFPILLLPLLIIYYYRNKCVKTRIIKCIKYGIVFALFAFIPYIIYIRDFTILNGALGQQSKITKGLYLFISQYFTNPKNLVTIINRFALIAFTILYVYNCVSLLKSKRVIFFKEMRKLYYFIMAFLFLLITNFQPWYLMWLTPFMLWQRSINIKLINQMQIMTIIANTVFLLYSENYKYGIPFFVIFVFGTLLYTIRNLKNRRYIIIKNK